MYNPAKRLNRNKSVKKISFTLSPLPPYVGLNFDLPAERVVKSLLSLKADPKLAGNLVAWCLQKVLDDQYTEGESAGAWSKRYPAYSSSSTEQKGSSNYESLTITFWIVEALLWYANEFSNEKLVKVLVPRLDLLRNYLKGHYDPKVKGFGVFAQRKLRGSRKVDITLRHTACGLRMLWGLKEIDSGLDRMVYETAGYISEHLLPNIPMEEPALTHAVLHGLLTTEGLSNIVVPSDKIRRSILKRLECAIVEKFNPSYGSWDFDSNLSEKTRIDYAFDILKSMSASSCLDKECSGMLEEAISQMCEKSLIPLDDNTMALPFCEDGKPDIGATIELLWCIIKNRAVFKPKKEIINKMVNFIADPSNRKDDLEFAYPWNLSSALMLATESE